MTDILFRSRLNIRLGVIRFGDDRVVEDRDDKVSSTCNGVNDCRSCAGSSIRRLVYASISAEVASVQIPTFELSTPDAQDSAVF